MWVPGKLVIDVQIQDKRKDKKGETLTCKSLNCCNQIQGNPQVQHYREQLHFGSLSLETQTANDVKLFCDVPKQFSS